MSLAQKNAELARTERALADYSDRVLSDATSEVRLDNCQHPSIGPLPLELRLAFAGAEKPPQQITSTDLLLCYDGESRSFKVLYAQLNFDNDYALTLSRYYTEPGNPTSDKRHFFGGILHPNGRHVTDKHEEALLSEDRVLSFLGEIGIALPDKSESADFKDVEALMQFSGQWATAATCISPLDLTHSLRLENRTAGSGFYDSARHPKFTDTFLRQIGLHLDIADAPLEKPTVSWRIVATSPNPNEIPALDPATYSKVELQYRKTADGGVVPLPQAQCPITPKELGIGDLQFLRATIEAS